MSLLAQTTWWLPPDFSEHGWQIDRLINWLHYFMGVLFVGWGIFLAYCMTRFTWKRVAAAHYTPVKAKASKVIEVAVIIFEVILLVVFSMPVLAKYKNEPPKPTDNPFEVHVVAQQFAWNIHYPGPDGVFGKRDIKLVKDATNPIGLDRDGDPNAKDDIVSNNQMPLPAGRHIVVKVTSKDVIHSFNVPMLRVKQDAVPGIEVPVWFKIKEGTSSDAIREQMARTVIVPAAGESTAAFEMWCRNNITFDEVKGADGKVVLKKGGEPGKDHLEALRAAGIKELRVGPRDPVEIHCTQLCGLTHYKMRGQVIIQSQADFDTWYAETAKGTGDFIED